MECKKIDFHSQEYFLVLLEGIMDSTSLSPGECQEELEDLIMDILRTKFDE